MRRGACTQIVTLSHNFCLALGDKSASLSVPIGVSNEMTAKVVVRCLAPDLFALAMSSSSKVRRGLGVTSKRHVLTLGILNPSIELVGVSYPLPVDAGLPPANVGARGRREELTILVAVNSSGGYGRPLSLLKEGLHPVQIHLELLQ